LWRKGKSGHLTVSFHCTDIILQDEEQQKDFPTRKIANARNHVALARPDDGQPSLALPPKRNARGVCGNWRQRAEVTCIALFGLFYLSITRVYFLYLWDPQ
jgi:hypothetical protein